MTTKRDIRMAKGLVMECSLEEESETESFDYKLGTRFDSEQETDEEMTKEVRIQQKLMDLTRRKNEPGRYLKDLRNKPKVSMVRVSRADAIKEIEKENRASKKEE